MQYMKQQNRPYSAIQVHDNLHKRIQKPTVERCLATLAEDGGGLRCKEYGKAKIYFIDQKGMETESGQAQLDALDHESQVLKKEVAAAQEEERAKNAALVALQREPTDANLEKYVCAAIGLLLLY